MVSRRRQPCAAPSIIATVGRPTEPIAKCVSAGTAAKQARRHQLNNTASIINILLYCHVGAEAVGSAYASASPDVPLSLHNIRGSALLRWLQSHFGSSTTVRVHRILAEPNADIRNSPLRHRPDEANMCAARAAQDGQRRSHTRQPEKIPPHVLMQAWNTRPPSFRRRSTVPFPSAALERSSPTATSGVPRRANHVCSTAYTATRDPAAWVVLRDVGDARTSL